MNNGKSYDFCIIGAGPIGIEMAVELKNQGASYVHLEAGQIGATIQWYAPGTMFFSSSDRIEISGVPFRTVSQNKGTREEYLTYLRSVVEQYDLKILTGRYVYEVTPKDGEFQVTHTSTREIAPGRIDYSPSSRSQQNLEQFQAKRIILAIGDMHRERALGVPGEDLSHVSHYLGDVHQYFRREVLIVGGMNSAVEAAIRLHRVGAHVAMSYRGKEINAKRIKYWLYPELKYLISKQKIAFFPETEVSEIKPDIVSLKNTSGKVFDHRADRVLLLTGYEQENHLFQVLGLELEGPQQKPQLNPETNESSVPGVFVIGTATAGTQLGGVKEFIETSHVHVEAVAKHIFGASRPSRDVDRNFLEN